MDSFNCSDKAIFLPTLYAKAIQCTVPVYSDTFTTFSHENIILYYNVIYAIIR